MRSSITLLVVCGFIAVSCVPLILGMVPPNRLYGFRTKKTLSDSGLWYRANRFAGWALLIGAAVSAALLALPLDIMPGNPLSAVIDLVGPLTIAVVACLIYLRKAGGGN